MDQKNKPTKVYILPDANPKKDNELYIWKYGTNKIGQPGYPSNVKEYTLPYDLERAIKDNKYMTWEGDNGYFEDANYIDKDIINEILKDYKVKNKEELFSEANKNVVIDSNNAVNNLGEFLKSDDLKTRFTNAGEYDADNSKFKNAKFAKGGRVKLINKHQLGGKTSKEKLVSKSLDEDKKMKKDLSKMKDHEKYQDFMQQLDDWIAKNPKVSLMGREIPSIYLKTLVPELAYLESDFNLNVTNQFGFKGYFQLSKDYFKGLDFDSQMKALIKHTNDKLKTLTSKDLERAYAHGYSDSLIIAKLHNQGFHLQDYLLNGKERYDGNGVPVSEYGNLVSGNSRLLKHLINQEEYNENNPPILKEGESSGTYAPYIRQVGLTPGILNYFDTNKVDLIQHPGDTIFLNKYQNGNQINYDTVINIALKGGRLKPKYKYSKEAYYDKNNDVIFAPDSTEEFYNHEYFHARPDSAWIVNHKPFYENLNDSILVNKFGADLDFVKRIDNDPNHFYNPEELGARVYAAKKMLQNAGINRLNNDMLNTVRKNERLYGDNFRDLLHMYNNENLIKLFNNE